MPHSDFTGSFFSEEGGKGRLSKDNPTIRALMEAVKELTKKAGLTATELRVVLRDQGDADLKQLFPDISSTQWQIAVYDVRDANPLWGAVRGALTLFTGGKTPMQRFVTMVNKSVGEAKVQLLTPLHGAKGGTFDVNGAAAAAIINAARPAYAPPKARLEEFAA